MAGKPDNPAMSPHAPEKNGHPSHWYTVESRGWGGREQKPLNAPHTMLLLPATPTNKRYSPKHEVPHTCASIVKPLTNRPQSLLVVYLVKLRLTSLNNIVALGGWVPETSWSFHYWQPAPRWRLHRWLANLTTQPWAPTPSRRTSEPRRLGERGSWPRSKSPESPTSDGTQQPKNCSWPW